MDIFKWFSQSKIDFSLIGLIRENKSSECRYYCTPTDAIIFARLGVDGVHFCLIPKADDLNRAKVYIVAPIDMNIIEPVAENLYLFFDMLITAKNANTFSWISELSKEKFKKLFYEEQINMDSPQEQQLLEIISQTVTPTFNTIDEVYDAVKELQSSFNINEINFSDEYYECTGLKKIKFS